MARKRIRRIVAFFLRNSFRFAMNIFYIVSCVVPKKSNLIVFSSWFGDRYADNPRYIFEHSVAAAELDSYWITKNPEVFRKLKENAVPVAMAHSAEGIIKQIRAGACVFSHSPWLEFHPFLISPKTKRIQAWHGIPLKKVGADSHPPSTEGLKERIWKVAFPYYKERTDLVLAAGAEDKRLLQGAFRVSPEKIVITGYPRNDVLFRCKERRGDGKGTKIMYAPTFRGVPGSCFPYLSPAKFNTEVVQDALARMDATLIIKLHPVQRIEASVRAKLDRCQRIEVLDSSSDVYVVVAKCDALVTDYSSVMFDFLLTGRRVYHLAFDLEQYSQRERGLYYDYESVCIAGKFDSWEKLLRAIESEQYDWSRHENMLKRFHTFADGNSSERAYSAVKKLMEGR